MSDPAVQPITAENALARERAAAKPQRHTDENHPEPHEESGAEIQAWINEQHTLVLRHQREQERSSPARPSGEESPLSEGFVAFNSIRDRQWTFTKWLLDNQDPPTDAEAPPKEIKILFTHSSIEWTIKMKDIRVKGEAAVEEGAVDVWRYIEAPPVCATIFIDDIKVEGISAGATDEPDRSETTYRIFYDIEATSREVEPPYDSFYQRITLNEDF